jgi:hypothetical protein
MTHHTHVAARTIETPWMHCVGGDCPSSAAHGGIVSTEICACGRYRSTEINGRHVHRGHWSTVAYDAPPTPERLDASNRLAPAERLVRR